MHSNFGLLRIFCIVKKGNIKMESVVMKELIIVLLLTQNNSSKK